jgi:hypothetical protein
MLITMTRRTVRFYPGDRVVVHGPMRYDAVGRYCHPHPRHGQVGTVQNNGADGAGDDYQYRIEFDNGGYDRVWGRRLRLQSSANVV